MIYSSTQSNVQLVNDNNLFKYQDYSFAEYKRLKWTVLYPYQLNLSYSLCCSLIFGFLSSFSKKLL